MEVEAVFHELDELTSPFPLSLSSWQSDVGSVLVVRADKKPLSANHVEAFSMLANAVLDGFGDEGGQSLPISTNPSLAS